MTKNTYTGSTPKEWLQRQIEWSAKVSPVWGSAKAIRGIALRMLEKLDDDDVYDLFGDEIEKEREGFEQVYGKKDD